MSDSITRRAAGLIVCVGFLSAGAVGCVSGRAVSYAIIGDAVVFSDDSGAVAVVTPGGVREHAAVQLVDSAPGEKWVVLRTRTSTREAVRKTDYDATRQPAEVTRTSYLAIDATTGDIAKLSPNFESADEKILGEFVRDGRLIVSTGGRFIATESHAERAWTLALPNGPWTESDWVSAAKDAPGATVRMTRFRWARDNLDRAAATADATLANRGRVRIEKTAAGWRTWYAPPGRDEIVVFAQNDLGAYESSWRINKTAQKIGPFR